MIAAARCALMVSFLLCPLMGVHPKHIGQVFLLTPWGHSINNVFARSGAAHLRMPYFAENIAVGDVYASNNRRRILFEKRNISFINDLYEEDLIFVAGEYIGVSRINTGQISESYVWWNRPRFEFQCAGCVNVVGRGQPKIMHVNFYDYLGGNVPSDIISLKADVGPQLLLAKVTVQIDRVLSVFYRSRSRLAEIFKGG